MRIINVIIIVFSGLVFVACHSQSKNNQAHIDGLEIVRKSTPNTLKIGYVGNMGVILEHGDKTVVIDGLHQFYKKAYVYPTKEIVNEMVTGSFKDFTSIEASLFTHVHGDHFSAGYAKWFLNENPDALVMGSHQIRDEINELPNIHDRILNQVKIIPYDARPILLNHKNIAITAIRCDHTNPSRHGQIQNLAYLVNLDGYKILHIGDTEWLLTKAPFKTMDVRNANIDIAILPYWMLQQNDAVKQASKNLSAKHIMVTHIPPNFSNQARNELHDQFSNITLLTSLGEVHYFKK